MKKKKVNMYENGSVMRGIGAGLYGIGEGILDTATFGMTDDLTDQGFTALQNAGNASESEKKTQLGIKGATNLAGAVGGGFLTGNIKGAIGEGTGGIADMGKASGNEDLARLGNAVAGLGNMANMGNPQNMGMATGNQGMAQAGNMVSGVGNMGMLGNMFPDGGSMNNKDTRTANQKKVDAELEAERQEIINEIAKLRSEVDPDPSKRSRELQNDSPGAVKIYPDDPRYKELWNPNAYEGVRKKAMEIAKPKFIYYNDQVKSLHYPVFEDSYDVPSIDISNEISSLEPKMPQEAPIGDIKINPKNTRFDKYFNPFSNEYEIMSPKQKNQLEKDEYMGKEPSIDLNKNREFLDPVTREAADPNDVISYKLQHSQNYPETVNQVGSSLLGISKAMGIMPDGSEISRKLKQSNQNQEYLDQAVKFNLGGPMNNGGFGQNSMNGIPVTEFKEGGTHEENPLGGIPQGIGQNGKPNMVEEGELKIDDPRNEGDSYIISADKTMKITKPLAKQYGVAEKYVGKSVKKVAEKILRKGSKREGDTIEENSKKLELKPLLDIHDELTARKKAKEAEEFKAKFSKLSEQYPSQMESAMAPEQQVPQNMAPQMPQMEGQMSPMPQMQRYGGKVNSYNPGGPFDTSINYKGLAGLDNPNPWNKPWQDNLGLNKSTGIGQQTSDGSFAPLTDAEKQLDQMPEYNLEQTGVNTAAQLLPAVYNIGMGLKKDDPINVNKLNKVKLEKTDLGQAEVAARRARSNAFRSLKSNAPSAGSYLANVSNAQRQYKDHMAGIATKQAQLDAQTANRETQMNTNIEGKNINLDLKEQLLQDAQEKQRQAMMAAGLSQVGQFAGAQQKDKLGLAYANMYSPDFQMEYDTPFTKLQKKINQ